MMMKSMAVACLGLGLGLLCGAQAKPAPAAARPPELAALNVSLGRWVFHGTSAPRTPGGQPGAWTWNEDCHWSPNHLFLDCTFSNVWSGRAIESLVVDTYNTRDHSYWHYEMFQSGSAGAHPFAAKMEIAGNTWTEYGAAGADGKPHERIVYVWGAGSAPATVKVTIETTKDGEHWTTADQGTGTRLGRG